MNTSAKTLMTIEYHCLQLSYASLRLHKKSLINQLVASIETHGQLLPVVVVSSAFNRWVLMDGYLRVKALRRLGRDTVQAEVWPYEPVDVLLMLLTEHQSRQWELLEEALLLQELHTQHGFSQNALAARIGRDQSWVSRRLSLLGILPKSALSAITQGKLSLWSATRVLAPMARAIPPHAELLLQHVVNNPTSTRELKNFYEHYQQSTQAQRSRMVNDPCLFFKAHQLLTVEKQAHALKIGPEGKWRFQLGTILNALKLLIPLVNQVFFPQQEREECSALLDVFQEVNIQFLRLTETIRRLTYADERVTTNDN